VRRKLIRPKLTWSPSRTGIEPTSRWPLTQVPLVEPRSRSTQRPFRAESSACSRETVSWLRRSPFAGSRPMSSGYGPGAGSSSLGSRSVCQARRSRPGKAEIPPTARTRPWDQRLPSFRSEVRAANSSGRRATRASSMRRMKVSCDSLPCAAPSLSTPRTRSRWASDSRAELVWNSKGDVTSTIVGPRGPECPDEAVFPPTLTCAVQCGGQRARAAATVGTDIGQGRERRWDRA
jgi:hypothetical protein